MYSTHCDLVIPATSSHPPSHKAAAFNSMAHRLHNVPLSATDYNKEVNTIIEIGKNNGYTREQISNIIGKHRRKMMEKLIYSPGNVSLENTQYIKLPYLGNSCYQVRRIVERSTGKKVAFSSSANLGRMLINCKDKVDKSRKSGVYQLGCKICDAIYIGQTGRNFKDRMNEHRRAVGQDNCTSAFAKHLYECNHSAEFSDFKILHECTKGKILDRLECIEIKRALHTGKTWLTILRFCKLRRC